VLTVDRVILFIAPAQKQDEEYAYGKKDKKAFLMD
jgi:hypothetical protein